MASSRIREEAAEVILATRRSADAKRQLPPFQGFHLYQSLPGDLRFLRVCREYGLLLIAL